MLQRSASVGAVGTASPSLKCRVLAYLYSHSFFPIPPPHKFLSSPHLSTQLRHTTPINCRYEEKKSYQIVLCPVTRAKRTVMNAPPKLDTPLDWLFCLSDPPFRPWQAKGSLDVPAKSFTIQTPLMGLWTGPRGSWSLSCMIVARLASVMYSYMISSVNLEAWCITVIAIYPKKRSSELA